MKAETEPGKAQWRVAQYPGRRRLGYRRQTKAVVANVDQRVISSLIFENLREGVFTIDQDCHITAFNPAAEHITGFSKAEVLGQYCFDVFRSERCNAGCALRSSMLDGEARERLRIPILTRDGRRIPISVTTAVLRDDGGKFVGAVELFRDRSEVEDLERRLSLATGLGKMISTNEEMQRIFSQIPEVAASECNTLITGPSGSGKELIAQALHDLSGRRDRPYLKINCGALPETLLESELFGYEKGAFTDAKQAKPGLFELARGGTLLLDEIGEMPLPLQVKILRVLSSSEFRPLGGTKECKADVRILASTNRVLEECVDAGRFREDLYYRINVVNIRLPALRDRIEDIPLLVDHFVARFREKRGRDIRGISNEGLATLRCYDFPGNVRELENAIEHAFVMCRGNTIAPRHLPSRILEAASRRPEALRDPPCERAVIKEALSRNGGNRQRTADELGMHRTTLWRKLQQFGLVG
jgi:PAS domain S-box-containing protein